MPDSRKQLIIFFHDEDLTKSLSDSLTHEFEVQRVATKDTMIPLIRQAKPCVVVFAKREIDRSLLNQIVHLRDGGLPIGIVVLAAYYDFKDEKEFFMMGADHYLLAATPTESLSVRLIALGRKMVRDRALLQGNLAILPRHENLVVTELDGQSLVISNQGLSVNGTLTDLPPIQLELLRLFLKNEGKLFTREDLIRLIWKGQNISSRSVDAQISKLKAKLGFMKEALRNRYGTGYSFERHRSRKTA